jgi:hypothetical protein
MAILKAKSWTPLQINRLPAPGYYLIKFTYSDGSVDITLQSILNGHTLYKREMPISNPYVIKHKPTWSRLLWSCSLTKNDLAKPHECEVISYYPTYADFELANPDLVDFLGEKAPNDF